MLNTYPASRLNVSISLDFIPRTFHDDLKSNTKHKCSDDTNDKKEDDEYDKRSRALIFIADFSTSVKNIDTAMYINVLLYEYNCAVRAPGLGVPGPGMPADSSSSINRRFLTFPSLTSSGSS